MTKALITFGCSWTFGVGVGYKESMSFDDYFNINRSVLLADQYSFRRILSQRYRFNNINFSQGGSSNQRQLRFAKKFFSSTQFQKLLNTADEIVVLWGITSTARTEVFSAVENVVKTMNFNLVKQDYLTKNIGKHFYNHEHEMFMLAHEIAHWNMFFKSAGIKNYWYDTFNHHDYTINNPALVNFEKSYNELAESSWPSWSDYVDKKIQINDNILDPSQYEFDQYVNRVSIDNFVIDQLQDRDLMSQLVIRNGASDINPGYHESTWRIDDDRVEWLVDQKLLNPHSFHPTKLGHEQIANMFDHLFEKTS